MHCKYPTIPLSFVAPLINVLEVVVASSPSSFLSFLGVEVQERRRKNN